MHLFYPFKIHNSGVAWSRHFSASKTPSTGSPHDAPATHPHTTTASGKASATDVAASTVNVPSDEVVTALPPLTQPLADMPPLKYATVQRASANNTQVTVLPNGLRVASEKRFGQFCTVGGRQTTDNYQDV